MTAQAHATWLYLKVYPADPRQTTAAITSVLAPLVARHRIDVRRWFFLRYLDQVGVHVRCRLLLAEDTADQVAARLPDLRRQLAALALPVADPGDNWPAGPGEPLVTLALYEPEYAKWGGPEAMVTAEQVFQVSSEVALRILPTLGPCAVDRIAAARLVVDRVLDGCALPDAARANFLQTHFQWWSGSDPGQVAALVAAARESSDAVADRLIDLAGRPGPTAQVDSFVHALRAAVSARRPEQKPLYLVFHHLHLMLNRLGVNPPEEAVTSLLSRPAALLSKPAA